jgi:uncharacterized membrane protein YagU involved in acid resistance
VLYSLCGLLLGVIASLTRIGREAEAPPVAAEAVQWMPPVPIQRPSPPPIEDEPVPVAERSDDPGATAG